MAWTVVGWLALAGRALGGRRRLLAVAASDKAAAIAHAASDRPDVFARQCSRRIAAASFADKKAYETALYDMGQDAPVIERAIASGAPVEAVAEFATAWSHFDADAKTIVRYPVSRRDAGTVTWGSVHVKQADRTTCGAASLAMMLMIGDPFVAAWVAVGRRAGWYLPAEALAAQVALDAGGSGTHTVAERWEALQRVMHSKVTRRGLALFPWPRSLGSPPWRVNNSTRLAGLRFRGALIDDGRADEMVALASHVRAAVADGIPVPLYSSGDSEHGLDTTIPRHVVLVVGLDGDGFLVYEPSSGAVHRMEMGVGTAAQVPALGRWNRVAWAVLPQVRGR